MISSTEEVKPWTLSPGYFLNLFFPHFPFSYFENQESTSLPFRYQLQLEKLSHSLQFLKPHFQLKSLGHLVALITFLATVVPPPTSYTTSVPSSFPLRLPIHLLRNPDPTIHSPRTIIVKSALEYFELNSFDWQAWIRLPSFFSQSSLFFPNTNLSFNALLSYVTVKLMENKFIGQPRLFLPASLKAHLGKKLGEFKRNVKELGWVLENDMTSDTTHVLYPHISHRKRKEDDLFIRSVEIQEKQCLVHPVYYPDSKDFWVNINAFSNLNNPYFYPPMNSSSLKFIDITWVLDSCVYHERMNELDYLVKIEGTILEPTFQQKWNPMFLVHESGLEPSPYAKSCLLPTSKDGSSLHFENARQNSESELNFKEFSSADKGSIPIVLLHLSTLQPELLLKDPELSFPEIESPTEFSKAMSQEEHEFLMSLSKRGPSLSPERYIELRNKCMALYQKAPFRILRFDNFKQIDPRISCVEYVQLISFWEHQEWVHHLLNISNSDPMPSHILGPLPNLQSSFTCPSCSKPILSPPYYQSLLHPSTYICASCFASGRFQGSSIQYKRVDPVPILPSDWTADEKLQLLYCVQKLGIDRWDLIAEEMKKPIESCLLHFILPSYIPKELQYAPLETMPNPVLSIIHTLLPYVPALAAQVAQQALMQLPNINVRAIYQKVVPFAFRLAQSEHLHMQPHLNRLFVLIFKRIETKWERLIQLDHWIDQVAFHKNYSEPSGSKPSTKPSRRKVQPAP